MMDGCIPHPDVVELRSARPCGISADKHMFKSL